MDPLPKQWVVWLEELEGALEPTVEDDFVDQLRQAASVKRALDNVKAARP